MNYEALLELAFNAAISAGEEILEIYSKPFRVNYKEDESPVTEADRRASREIVKQMAPSGIPVISEEEDIPAYEQRMHLQKFWLVDPLDGTKEFVKRNGEFSVNIGLIEDNYPTLGVVYMPVLKEIYFAAKGLGAFKIPHEVLTQNSGTYTFDEMIASARKLPIYNPPHFTIVASRSHLSKETYAHIEKKKSEHGSTDIVYSGSSVKMCWVAEGKAHEYPRYGRTMEWDTAAGQIIVEESGGKFLSLETGERLSYNKVSLANPNFIALRDRQLR